MTRQPTGQPRAVWLRNRVAKSFACGEILLLPVLSDWPKRAAPMPAPPGNASSNRSGGTIPALWAAHAVQTCVSPANPTNRLFLLSFRSTLFPHGRAGYTQLSDPQTKTEPASAAVSHALSLNSSWKPVCYPPLSHGSSRFEVDDRGPREFRAPHRWECLTVQGESLRALVLPRPLWGPPTQRVAAVRACRGGRERAGGEGRGRVRGEGERSSHKSHVGVNLTLHRTTSGSATDVPTVQSQFSTPIVPQCVHHTHVFARTTVVSLGSRLTLSCGV